MRARATQVQAPDRSAISRMSQQRPHREQLIERQLAMKDVAAGKPVLPFKVERCDDLRTDDLAADTWSWPFEHRDHGIEQRITRDSPIARPQRARRIVHVNRRDMRTLRRQAVVDQRRNRQLEPRPLGELSVFCMVECALDVIEIRSDLVRSDPIWSGPN